MHINFLLMHITVLVMHITVLVMHLVTLLVVGVQVSVQLLRSGGAGLGLVLVWDILRGEVRGSNYIS